MAQVKWTPQAIDDEEAEKRWLEIENGKVQCIPAEEVMKKARENLQK